MSRLPIPTHVTASVGDLLARPDETIKRLCAENVRALFLVVAVFRHNDPDNNVSIQWVADNIHSFPGSIRGLNRYIMGKTTSDSNLVHILPSILKIASSGKDKDTTVVADILSKTITMETHGQAIVDFINRGNERELDFVFQVFSTMSKKIMPYPSDKDWSRFLLHYCTTVSSSSKAYQCASRSLLALLEKMSLSSLKSISVQDCRAEDSTLVSEISKIKWFIKSHKDSAYSQLDLFNWIILKYAPTAELKEGLWLKTLENIAVKIIGHYDYFSGPERQMVQNSMMAALNNLHQLVVGRAAKGDLFDTDLPYRAAIQLGTFPRQSWDEIEHDADIDETRHNKVTDIARLCPMIPGQTALLIANTLRSVLVAEKLSVASFSDRLVQEGRLGQFTEGCYWSAEFVIKIKEESRDGQSFLEAALKAAGASASVIDRFNVARHVFGVDFTTKENIDEAMRIALMPDQNVQQEMQVSLDGLTLSDLPFDP